MFALAPTFLLKQQIMKGPYDTTLWQKQGQVNAHKTS